MRCCYNAVNCLQNIHKRCHIACLSELGIRCLLWVQFLIDIQPQFLQWCVQYHVILDHVITALDSTSECVMSLGLPLQYSTCSCFCLPLLSNIQQNAILTYICVSGDLIRSVIKPGHKCGSWIYCVITSNFEHGNFLRKSAYIHFKCLSAVRNKHHDKALLNFIIISLPNNL